MTLIFLRFYNNVSRKDLLDKLNVVHSDNIPCFSHVSIANDTFNTLIVPHDNDFTAFDQFICFEYLIRRRPNLTRGFQEGLRMNFYKFEFFYFITWLFMYLHTSDFAFFLPDCQIMVTANHLRGTYDFMLPSINRMPIMPDEFYNISLSLKVRMVIELPTVYSFTLLLSSFRLGCFFCLKS